MKIRAWVRLQLIVLALLISACASSAPPTPAPSPTPHPGEALVTSRCVTCHALDAILAVRYDHDDWLLVVDRMVASGAQVNDTQKAQIADYLAVTYPKAR